LRKALATGSLSDQEIAEQVTRKAWKLGIRSSDFALSAEDVGEYRRAQRKPNLETC